MDAFELDYLDEPLVALVSEISARFEVDKSVYESIIKEGKNIAVKLLRPAIRIGAAYLTAGFSEVFTFAGQSVLSKASDEIDSASAKFWQKEDSRRQAVQDFRGFLKRLTTGDDKAPAKKIVVVIDELDRCRPDYALSMLEIIKHFFDVNNVHFILGVNLAELENMARARYGEKLDARNYIGKFIKVKVEIPEAHPDNRFDSGWEVFFDKTAKEMNFNGTFKSQIRSQLRMLRSKPITLRTIQRLLTAAAVVPNLASVNKEDAYKMLMCTIFIYDFFKEETKPISKSLTFSDFQKVFNLNYNSTPQTQDDLNMNYVYGILVFALDGEEFSALPAAEQQRISQLFFTTIKPNIATLLRDYVLFATART